MISEESFDAERAVLGAILLDNPTLSIVSPILKEADFFSRANRRIFRTILDLSERSSVIDLVTTRAELDRSGAMDEVGGPAYLASLIDGIPDVFNAEHYARIVKDRATEKAIVDAVACCTREIESGRAPREVAIRLNEQLSQLASSTQERPPKVLRLLEFLALERPAVPSFWGEGTLSPKTLNLLAGGGGVGKSALVANLVLCLSGGVDFLGIRVPGRVRVLFLEMEGNPDAFRARLGSITTALGLAGQDLAVFFAERPADFSIGTAALELAIVECEADLVVLDTIGLFHDGDENSNSDFKAFVVKPLRQIADRRGTAFLLVHHLSKPTEGRSAKTRIRGASAMFDDLDTVLTLEPSKADPRGERILAFEKTRNGPELESLVLRFEQAAGVFRLTEKDAVVAAKPRLAEVQRIVFERGRLRTGELSVALQAPQPAGLGIGRSQAEDLISAAHQAGLISRPSRGWYEPPGDLLSPRLLSPIPPASIEAAGETGEERKEPRIPRSGDFGETGESGKRCGYFTGQRGEPCSRCGADYRTHLAVAGIGS